MRNAQNNSDPAFYTALGPEAYRANRPTIGPWDEGLQHGGPPAALLGRALERLSPSPHARIVRLAFDFFTPVPVTEVTISAEVERSGKRIQLSSATMTAGNRRVLRASAWHIVAESGRSPVHRPEFVAPQMPMHESEAHFADMDPFPYGQALEWRFVRGGLAELGPATVWTRCRIPLVHGESTTGLQRVLVMIDAANGISAVLPLREWTFVPVDLLVVLERIPAAEWIGMDAQMTMTGDGIGMTSTTLFDETGAFGRALQTLYVAPR